MSQTADNRRLSELRSLLQVIEDAGWEYARVELDGVTLVVSSDPDLASGTAAASPAHSPAPSSASAEPVPSTAPGEAVDAATEPVSSSQTSAAPVAEGQVETITSPTIGLFWRSPKPGAPPFVDVGDTVAAGDTVCIVEVMKLMTHVTSPVAGTVRAIRIDNGAMVEHGTELVDIEPAEAS